MSKGKCSNEQLVVRIKAGIDVADNMFQLWQQNQGFVATIAKRFRGYEDMEDLMQQGYIGLCQAVDGYDPDEGVPFINYAGYWIRQSMQRYIEDCGNIVRLPVHARNRVNKFKKLCNSFESYFGRKPTDEELEYYLGVSENVLEDIKKSATMLQIGSLDVPVGEDEDGSMYDLLPGPESPEGEIVDHLQNEQLRETLWGMVDELPGQQPAVIRMRYLGDQTFGKISEQVGRSYQRTVQIHNDALRQLRRPRYRKKLEPFLDGEIYSSGLKGNGLGQFNRTWTSSTERAAIALADLEGEIAREKEWMRRASWSERH